MRQITKRILHLLKRHGYLIDGKLHTLKYMGNKTKELEVWYDSKEVKAFMTEFPMSEFFSKVIGRQSQLLAGIEAPFVLITNETKVNDNWYYPDDRVWLITLRGAVETVREALVEQKKDTEVLDSYCMKQGWKI